MARGGDFRCFENSETSFLALGSHMNGQIKVISSIQGCSTFETRRAWARILATRQNSGVPFRLCVYVIKGTQLM
jgi:hypothetical protein